MKKNTNELNSSMESSWFEQSKKTWLNPQEVNQDYGFSVSTLAKWRMNNLYLPYSKIGKYIKYNRTNIELFLKTKTIEVQK